MANYATDKNRFLAFINFVHICIRISQSKNIEKLREKKTEFKNNL